MDSKNDIRINLTIRGGTPSAEFLSRFEGKHERAAVIKIALDFYIRTFDRAGAMPALVVEPPVQPAPTETAAEPSLPPGLDILGDFG